MNQANGLSNAEAERLMILSNMMGQLQTTITAIMLHGHNSISATEHICNKRALSKQCTDVSAAISLMIGCGDICKSEFEQLLDKRAVEIVSELRFNGDTAIDIAAATNDEHAKSWSDNVRDIFRGRKKKT